MGMSHDHINMMLNGTYVKYITLIDTWGDPVRLIKILTFDAKYLSNTSKIWLYISILETQSYSLVLDTWGNIY